MVATLKHLEEVGRVHEPVEVGPPDAAVLAGGAVAGEEFRLAHIAEEVAEPVQPLGSGELGIDADLPPAGTEVRPAGVVEG